LRIKTVESLDTTVWFDTPDTTYKPIRVFTGGTKVQVYFGETYGYFTPDDARFLADLIAEAAGATERNIETDAL